MDELSTPHNLYADVSSIPSLKLDFDMFKHTLISFDLYSSFCTFLQNFLLENGFEIEDFFMEV